MANDGQVVFEITADGKKAIANIKDITKAIEAEGKKWDTAAKNSTDGIEASFGSMVKKVVAGISAAKVGREILNWGKAAISAASDLAEVQNVVDVTFGEGASKIEAWSKTASRQFGLTETQAKKFTSTLGAMMKSSGIAGDEIIDMSTSLAGLAADMASFYNLDFETAFQKIRSGISGETEPLKQLGINMSIANLEAFALQQGIEKSFNAMSQGEQTMLRYQYLMQATADAQGDFERTADGFANASRRVEAAMETINTKGGALLMEVIEPLTTGLATFLEKATTTPERTVLDDFNDINVDTANKLAALDETYTQAQNVISLIDELEKTTIQLGNGTTMDFGTLFRDLTTVENNGGDIREYLKSLGVDVDFVAQKYQVWKKSFDELEGMVPGLTGDIRSQNEAIDDTAQALQANLDAWKANEEKKLLWAAYYAKERALTEKKAELYSYEFDYGAAREAAKKARDALANIYKLEFDENGDITNKISLPADRMEQYKADLVHYNLLLEKEKDTKAELERQTNSYAFAEKELADGKAALIEKTGEQEKVTQEVTEKVKELTTEQKASISAAQEAAKALADYVDSVRDSTEKAVDGIVKGFAKITRPADELVQKRSELIKQQQELDRSTKGWEKEYEKLDEQINKLNESIDDYSPKSMQDGLKSQIAFMEEYIKNLEKARELGLSNELLASLSDGSVESAEYLSQLVANPTQAAEVDELYKKVEETKAGFTDALTQQKLTVDETYNAMVAKAKETITQINLGDEAATASGETVSGIASGINNHVSEVAAAVDSVIAELSRLNSYGISLDFGTFGQINFSLDGSHATGLDFVPFDGYLAELHEGEGILNAEENRIWQRFKNGDLSSRNVDYDALGGVMRDNVKAGGDVYLDGRTVGSVISDMQGRSYRSLKRSGWQS